MGEVIVITSGKGGVGKTTTTANLGSALALAGKKVALVDTDIGLRNLDVVMGLENRIVYDLVDVIEGKCTVEELVSQLTVDEMAQFCVGTLRADMGSLARVNNAIPETAVFANTGCKVNTIEEIFKIADGAVVGTTFKKDGKFENHVEKARVVEFMDKVRSIR